MKIKLNFTTFTILILFGTFTSMYFNNRYNNPDKVFNDEIFSQQFESVIQKSAHNDSKDGNYSNYKSSDSYNKRSNSNFKNAIKISRDDASKKKNKKKKTKKKRNKKKISKENRNIDNLSKDKIAVLQSSLQIYKKQSDYPLNSYPTYSHIDPLAENIQPKAKESEDPESNVTIKIWKNKNYFLVNEDPIDLFLEVYDNDTKIIPEKIIAELYNAEGKKQQEIKYIKQNDLTYTSKITISEDQNFILGKYLIKINVINNNKTSYLIDTFSLQNKKVQFKHSVKDNLNSNKNLIINTNFDVYEDGPYLSQATLYDNNNKLSAFSENPVNLGAGNNWIPIEFHGYIFYKNKHSGPFTLKHVRLSYVKPNLSIIRYEAYTPNFKTANYQWNQFNSSAADNTIMKNKVTQIESFLSFLN